MPNPRTVLPESPMKIPAGGKLKTKNPKQTPSKLHATAVPRRLSVKPGNMRYAAAMIPVTPAHRPSEPSRKLNELMKSAINTQEAARLTGPMSQGNRQAPDQSKIAPPTWAASRKVGERLRMSSMSPAVQIKISAAKKGQTSILERWPEKLIPAANARVIATPPKRGIGFE